MTTLESTTEQLSVSAGMAFDFLADLNNHALIMPDQVTNWKSDATTCSFTIKGTGDVHLRIKEKSAPSRLILEPNGKIPFPFTVNWHISANGDHCSVQAIMDAELNAILRMVASGPLTNFLNLQVQNLVKHFHDRTQKTS